LKYTGELKRSAAKMLRKLSKSTQKRIISKLSEIENSLPSLDETKLKGNNPFHRIRVGDYRIIYEIQNEVLIILVIKIGHRKDIYKRLL